MLDTKHFIKNAFVSLIISAILTVIAYLVAGITSLILSIPGLKLAQKNKSAIPSYVAAASEGLAKEDGTESTLDMYVESPIEDAQKKMGAYLLSKGVPEHLVAAAVLQQNRLMWSKGQWDEYAELLVDLSAEVVPTTLELHVGMSMATPSFDSCKVLDVALNGGIEDLDTLKTILDHKFTLVDLEKMFGFIDVHDLDCASAANKIAFDKH